MKKLKRQKCHCCVFNSDGYEFIGLQKVHTGNCLKQVMKTKDRIKNGCCQFERKS